jgi:hypothetical protein
MFRVGWSVDNDIGDFGLDAGAELVAQGLDVLLELLDGFCGLFGCGAETRDGLGVGGAEREKPVLESSNGFECGRTAANIKSGRAFAAADFL